MKILFDIFPVILFFITFRIGENNIEKTHEIATQLLANFISGGILTKEQAPIILATAITILASVAQIIYSLLSKKKINSTLWISFFVITIFGGATIYFHNDTFIKWKPTVLSWCYAIAFILAQFIFKSNMLRVFMGSQITLPEKVWSNLSLAWIAYFVLFGFLNLYVAFNFPLNFWVNYKLYSLAGLPIFIVAQSLFLGKYIEETE